MSATCPNCGAPANDGSAVCATCGTDLRPVADVTAAWQHADPGPAAAPVGRRFGRFVLLAELGSGGFGSVYKATDPQLDRTVAVKVPNAAWFDGAEARERFVREARAAARLAHPNIVPVYEVGEHDGLPFIVSEFIDGPSLAELLKTRRPTFAESAALVARLADALHSAHELGVVHRDVKPGNILLQRTEDRGQRSGNAEESSSDLCPLSSVLLPKITDFGLAKREGGDAGLTTEGQVLGTPAYMSPEQARGEAKHADRRTDVYGLGAVLYQLLTGEVPFRGNARMTLLQVLHDDPRPPRELDDRVPRDLETVCLKCLEKAPGRRYATAKDLADDLGRFLNNESISARPPSPWDRARKFTRRNRPLVLGAAATVLALVLGVAGTTYGMLQARAEAENAKAAQGRAEEAERDRRAELANTRAAAARLAAQRGRWRDALAHYRAAIDLGAADDVGPRLGMLECRLALYDFAAFRAELAALDARPDLGPHRGMVLLYRGVDEFYGSDEKADPLGTFRAALAAGLPPAEESYARAVLSPELTDAVAHLRSAIRSDPFHARAHDLLTLVLFLHGRLDEAREALIRYEQLSPYSLTATLYRVVERALSGDLAAAHRLCDEARGELGEAHALFRGLATLLHDLTREDAFWEANSPLQARLLQEFAALAPRMSAVLGEKRPAANLGAFNMVRLGLFRSLAKSPAFGTGNPAELLALFARPGGVKALVAEMKRVVPMGFLDYAEGQILQEEGKLAEAEAAYRRALVTPSLVPAVRRTKLVLLGVLEARALKAPPGPERGKLFAELRALLWEVFRAGPYPIAYSGVLIRLALGRDESGMALALAEDWVRRAPDDPKALRALADVQMHLGMWDRRVRTLHQLQKQNPDDAGLLNEEVAAYLALGQRAAAVGLALDTLRKRPGDATAAGHLDFINRQFDSTIAAEQHLRDKLRAWRLLVLARLDHRWAAVAVADVPAGGPPGELVAAASVLSACAAGAKVDASLDLLERAVCAAEYAGRAASLLRRADAAGHFGDPHRAAAVRSDPDLRAAVAHPDCPEALRPPRPKKKP